MEGELPYILTDIEWSSGFILLYRPGHFYVHLRCLSTGDGHLRSPTDGLEMPEGPCSWTSSPACWVYADYVALVATFGGRYFLFVWNWCTGALLLQLVRVLVPSAY